MFSFSMLSTYFSFYQCEFYSPCLVASCECSLFSAPKVQAFFQNSLNNVVFKWDCPKIKAQACHEC